MLTREQAFNANEFHYGPCNRIVGPRGGKKISQEIWRRNGETQFWKTRPEEFRIPVKRGLKQYGSIWHYDAEQVHAASECPLNMSTEKPIAQHNYVGEQAGYLVDDAVEGGHW